MLYEIEKKLFEIHVFTECHYEKKKKPNSIWLAISEKIACFSTGHTHAAIDKHDGKCPFGLTLYTKTIARVEFLEKFSTTTHTWQTNSSSRKVSH